MPAGNAASAQDVSPHAAPPENKSTMTACQTVAQSPSGTPHAASAPTTPPSPLHQNLEHIPAPSHPLHLVFQDKVLRRSLETTNRSMNSQQRELYVNDRKSDRVAGRT